MYYKIYPDVIFLANLLMDYTVLYVSGRLCKITTTYARIAVSACAGAVWSVIAAICRGIPFVPEVFCTYLVIPALMIFIMGGKTNLPELVRRYIVFMLTAVLAGGVLGAAAKKGRDTLWMAFAVFMFAQAAVPVVRYVTGYVRRKNLLCDVWLELGGRGVHTMGLYDTGNSLIDPYNGRPVCVAERKLLEKLMNCDGCNDGIRLIPYRSLGNEHGLMRLATMDSMTIEYDGKRTRYEKPELAVYEGKLSGGELYGVILNAACLEKIND